jgi:glycine C-acetyltransferase
MKAFELIDRHPQMVKILADHTKYFRDEMTRNGFQIKPGVHPIVPIMLGDEKRTVEMARQMNSKGIFVVGFSYPVVPKGEARIRVQISAIHTREQLDKAIRTFTEVGKALQLI